MTANRSRLAIATLLTFALVLTRQTPWWGPWGGWFLLSGAVGLGLGDIALFEGYRRIGTRLTVLLTYGFGIVLAAAIEWVWLGDTLRPSLMLCCALVLVGVCAALAPEINRRDLKPGWPFGICCGCLSGLALAWAGVLTRRAAEAGIVAGMPADGISGALLRNVGALALLALFWPLTTAARRGRQPRHRADWRCGWGWLLATGLIGPGLGVITYQYALIAEPAALVHAIIGTLPVVVMPLAWLFDGDRPRPIAVIGGIVAVLGAVGIALLRAAD